MFSRESFYTFFKAAKVTSAVTFCANATTLAWNDSAGIAIAWAAMWAGFDKYGNVFSDWPEPVRAGFWTSLGTTCGMRVLLTAGGISASTILLLAPIMGAATLKLAETVYNSLMDPEEMEAAQQLNAPRLQGVAGPSMVG